MKLIKIVAIVILLFFACTALAQRVNFNQGSINQRHYYQTVSYQEVKGLLLIPVTINGKTYNFLFDTGAVFAISDKLFQELNPPVIGQGEVSGSSGEKKEMRYFLLPKLCLQGITFINTPGVVFHEDAGLFECLGIDGIIGSNMLRKSVVHIDVQSKHIIITNSFRKLSLEKSTFQKMELSSTQCSPFIKVVLQKGEKKASHKVLFDSGQNNFFNMSMNVYKWLTSRTDIVNKIAESEGSFSSGIHGLYPKQNHLLLNIPSFVVNTMTFNDLIIPTTHDSNSRIGAKLFQYGKTTLDYKKKRFYFSPFDNVNTHNLSERPWAISLTIENDKRVVGIIWEKTLESQINLGDEALSINGIDIQSMNYCDLYLLEIDNLASGGKYLLDIRDIITGEIKQIAIKRLELVEQSE